MKSDLDVPLSTPLDRSAAAVADRISSSGYSGAAPDDQAAFDRAYSSSQAARSLTLQQARDAADKAAQGQTMDLGSSTLHGGTPDGSSDGTSAEDVVRAAFPRTSNASDQGKGFLPSALAGVLDAASLPGRALAAIPRYSQPYLQSMGQTEAAPGTYAPAQIAENIMRDPLTVLAAGTGGLASSAGKALASGLGKGLAARSVPALADMAANTGTQALAQYGTTGRVDPRSLALTAALRAGAQGLGEGVSQMAPKARATILDNPNFQKWFGASKVVDEAGNPLVVYHGTNGDFDKFDPKMSRDIGVHFGTAEQANTFGNNAMPSYLQLKNPLQVDDRFSRENGLSAFLEDAYYDLDMTPAEADKFRKLAKASESKWSDSRDFDNTQVKEFKVFWKGMRKVLKRSGYDGIVYPNAVEGSGNSYAVFDPTQIKSATGNRGTFDPTDPNITHLVGGGTQIPVMQGSGSGFAKNALGRAIRNYNGNQRDNQK